MTKNISLSVNQSIERQNLERQSLERKNTDQSASEDSDSSQPDDASPMLTCDATGEYEDKAAQQETKRQAAVRWLLFLAGGLALLLGIIGILLPVMPTAPFVILAAACWAKSSERFHGWLIEHRYLGKYVRNWQDHRAIPKQAKWLAWAMMCVSATGLFLTLPTDMQWMAYVVAVVYVLVIVWMARLPNA